MTILKTQISAVRKSRVGEFASSIGRVAEALIGNGQLLHEFSAAAAHYDGLIDCIEQAGWDLSRLEKVKHAFDETAEQMLRELLETHPDMSKSEEQSFLAPFSKALHQFVRMSQQERLAFRREYARFADLHAQTLEELSASETV